MAFDYTVNRAVIESRSSKPFSGPRFYWQALWLRVRVLFVAIHWTADPNVEAKTTTVARCITYLANMHDSYLRSRGYSLGYSVAIDQAGNSYELRGTTFRPAATLGRNLTRGRLEKLTDPDIGLFRHLVPEGSRNGNRHTVAVLFLCGPAGPSYAALVEAARFIDWSQRESGRRLEIRPHSFFDPTACPGDAARVDIGEDGPTDLLRRLVVSRAWSPTIPTNPTPSPITTGADDMAYQYHQRVYDSRTDGAAAVTHQVKVHDGPCNAKLNVSAIANERGSFAVAGGDDRDRALTSAAGNFDPDGVTNASVEVGTPDGQVWVQCSAPAHVVIDVQGVQAIG